MIKKESVLAPVKTDDSPSKAIQGAAREPENWQKLGTDSVQEALREKHQAHPINPEDLK